MSYSHLKIDHQSASNAQVESSSAACACIGVVSVFDYIPLEEQAAILAGNSTYDCTADIHTARDAVSGSGKVLLFPGGTYYVSEVVFAGEDYTIATSGVTFQQKPGLTGDHHPHPIIAFTPASRNIRVGDLHVRGNIATDTDESSHGVMVASAKGITIGNISGEDLRGDVLYTYGRTTSEAEMQRDLVTGIVRGKNIYRCIVALAGGDATIAGIVQDGPVGYRDLDVEPNMGGAYQPVRVDIGFLRGSVVQITSEDSNIVNESVRIGHLDLDGTRISNSSVPYSHHGGVNSFALYISNIDTVEIGKLKLRNYASYPVYMYDRWREVRIGTLDFENCDTEDTTYKTIIRQEIATPVGARILIDRVSGRLSAHNPGSPSSPVIRTVFLSETNLLPVVIQSVNLIGGTLGVRLTGTIGAGQVDCADGFGEIFLNACQNLTLTGLNVINSTSTHGFNACRCVTLIGCAANFGASLDYASGSTAILGINSAINGSLVPGPNVLAP